MNVKLHFKSKSTKTCYENWPVYRRTTRPTRCDCACVSRVFCNISV